MPHLRSIIALSLLAGTTACVETTDLETEGQEIVGNSWSYRVPGMVRFRSANAYGETRWHTGLLVTRSGQTGAPFSSRLVITAGSAFRTRWAGQCIPETIVQHGWLHTNTPEQNELTESRVVAHLGHPWLPITALVLRDPLSAERTFPAATGLPAFTPQQDSMRCWGYSAGSGNLLYAEGRPLATSWAGYLWDAVGFGGTHKLNYGDLGAVCTDTASSSWYGMNSHEWWLETTNARDIDGDGRDDTIESRDACQAENLGQPTNGACLTSHAAAATLAPWIDAQMNVVNLVNPTQFTTRLWFESAANPVCADIPSGSFGDVNVNQWTCHRQANQLFYEIPHGNGVAWVNVSSGKCWTALNGGVVQRPCNLNDVNQRWQATPTTAPAPAGRILRSLGALNQCVTAQGSAISVQLRLSACPTASGAGAAQVWKTNHPTGLAWCSP